MGWERETDMTIDIRIFGFAMLYFALISPYSIATQKICWEWFSLRLCILDTQWSIGWIFETDYRAIFLGPWQWKRDLEI